MEKLAIGCRTPCLHPIREKVSERLAQSGRNLWAISNDLTNSDSEMQKFESCRPNQPVRSPSPHIEGRSKPQAAPRPPGWGVPGRRVPFFGSTGRILRPGTSGHWLDDDYATVG